MRGSLTLVTLAALAVAAPPALAEPVKLGYEVVSVAPGATWASSLASDDAARAEASPERPAPPSPTLAAGLTVGTPLMLGLTAIVVPALSQGGGMFLPLFVPLGLAAGHVYAGEPLRGLAVTGLGVAGLMVVYAAGVSLAFAGNGRVSFLSLPVMALGTLGVFGWAGLDAYQTAERAAQGFAR